MGRKIPERVVITVKDIENILGKSARAARKYMALLRRIYGKPSSQFITVEEFCAVSGLTEEQVKEFL